jgi:transcriptional regulator with XRE-family HTH domain
MQQILLFLTIICLGTNMNKNWPQQEVFCQKVKQFCERNGLTTTRGAIKLDIASDLFNLSEITLKQFLQYKSRSRPHYDTLSFIAGVIGCSVTEFMDDPGDPPPGTGQEKWSEMTERERVIASTMITDIVSKDMSASEKEELFGAYQEMRARILRLKEMQARDSCKTKQEVGIKHVL